MNQTKPVRNSDGSMADNIGQHDLAVILNQCDGCRVGSAIVNGNHVTAQGVPYMSCQAWKYGAKHARELHCTHPEQAWCDCDWCRFIRSGT